jgi:hypothetical protein
MRNPLTFCVASALLLLSTGCATITRGDKQTVKIVSDPTAANLVIDGKPYVTPASVILKRKQAHDITLSKEGYQTITFKLNAHWDGGGLGPIALDAAVPGGSAMFVIDFLAGADRKFNDVAVIKLPPALSPDAKPITLYEFKGKLLAKAEYDVAVEKDKLFGKKSPTTAPAPAKSNLHETAGTN